MIDLLILFGLAALASLIYVFSLNGEFVYDDLAILEVCDQVWDRPKYLARKIKRPNLLEGIGRFRYLLEQVYRRHRTLLYWSYFRDARTHGKANRWGWHATNIELHAIAACLVYALLRAFFPPISAGIGAMIFAVHPMATSSVALIYGRSSMLCGVFYLAGLLAALIGGWAWLLVPVCFVCGWLSKQEILMLPAAILVMVFVLR